jgi:hypothetical protein
MVQWAVATREAREMVERRGARMGQRRGKRRMVICAASVW